jgi:hypothetical protein
MAFTLAVAIWLALGYGLWRGRAHTRWPSALVRELSWAA